MIQLHKAIIATLIIAGGLPGASSSLLGIAVVIVLVGLHRVDRLAAVQARV